MAAIATTVAALGALWFTSRSLVATNNQFELSRQEQITDRFAKGAEQLSSDKSDVRVAGIYLLERLAKDSPPDHPTIMDLLTSFVRTHSPVTSCPPLDVAARSRDAFDPEKRQPADVQAVLTVIGRRDAGRDNGHDIDLLRTCIAGARLDGANLAGANLSASSAAGASMQDTVLTYAAFADSNLSGAWLSGADLSGAIAARANFQNANLPAATMRRALLLNSNLVRADLPRADLSHALLQGANMSGANLAAANLTDADLTDAKLDDIFYDARTVWPQGFTPPPSRPTL
ncbi:pentapeptide repeat-containing protein [Nocardia amamiensis]|uniref:pentapeptide repeat-containing protein n=1 Tax=Nocardia TaxID=1817 RepID=UPI003406F16E